MRPFSDANRSAMNLTRVVEIDDVNPERGIALGRCLSDGGLYTIDLLVLPAGYPFMPSQGERWYVRRDVSRWVLYQKILSSGDLDEVEPGGFVRNAHPTKSRNLIVLNESEYNDLEELDTNSIYLVFDD